MVRLLVSPAIVGVVCCALAPAAAARTGEIGTDMTVTGAMRGVTRTQIVSLAGLDLRRDAHVARADSRLRFASKQVCDTSATQGLYQKRDYGLCFDQALTSARSDLDRHVALARGG
ncbi:UrcA family protein [Sphingomonas sp. BT-65]|uniref:UrcA family protein n=1 Tax=Sphingomonas sp. BT-65 TaxID=2989821 RepID=UPI002235E523|nr:UrcA family protein [Sphingomonas sp. BT-65]MCW4460970.1 UrcA family protein [Sphingomonas sp. BT-65]